MDLSRDDLLARTGLTSDENGESRAGRPPHFTPQFHHRTGDAIDPNLGLVIDDLADTTRGVEKIEDIAEEIPRRTRERLRSERNQLEVAAKLAGSRFPRSDGPKFPAASRRAEGQPFDTEQNEKGLDGCIGLTIGKSIPDQARESAQQGLDLIAVPA